MAVDLTVGSTSHRQCGSSSVDSPSLSKNGLLQPLLPGSPMPQMPKRSDLQIQPFQPGNDVAPNRPITWPLMQSTSLTRDPASDNPSSQHRQIGVDVRPQLGLDLTCFPRLRGSGTEVLGEALQRLKELQVGQQQSAHQRAVAQQLDQMGAKLGGKNFQPSNISSLISGLSLTASSITSGTPVNISAEVMHGSQLSSLNDLSLNQPRFESKLTSDASSSVWPCPDVDVIGSRSRPVSGLSPFPDITEAIASQSKPSSSTSLMAGGLLVHEVSSTVPLHPGVLSSQGFPSIDNVLIHTAVNQDTVGVQSHWMTMQAVSPHAEIRALNQTFPQQLAHPRDFSQHFPLSWQQQQQQQTGHLMVAKQATALLQAMAAAQSLGPVGGMLMDSSIQGHRPVSSWPAQALPQVMQTQQPVGTPWSHNLCPQPHTPVHVKQQSQRMVIDSIGGYSFGPELANQNAATHGRHNQIAPQPPLRGTVRGLPSAPPNLQAEGSFVCDSCKIQCNSAINLEQHIQSRKHLARAAR